MVVAAALAQAPVSVDYTYRGSTDGLAWQQGDEILASPTLLREWDWKVELGDRDAELEAEGRQFRLPIRLLDGRKVLSLNEALRFVGGTGSLEGSVYRVHAQVRQIRQQGDSVTIDSTLAVQPRAFRLQNPDRLVIDLKGAVLAESAQRGLPQGWRVGQHEADTVRLVFEGEDVARIPVPKLMAGRHLEASLAPVANPDPDPVQKQSDDPNLIPLPEPKAIAGRFTAKVDPPKLVRESDREAVYALPYMGQPDTEPRAKYVDPHTIEVVLKGVSPTYTHRSDLAASRVLAGHTLSETETGARILLRTHKPSVFEVSKRNGMFEVRLTIPEVSDGKLGGKVVVVDAGHGGKDSGTNYQGLVEKSIALAAAKELAEELTRQGASVIMTRKDDRFVELQERADVANEAEADLFVSVHINGHPRRGSVSGGMTFHHKNSDVGLLLAECIQAEIAKVSELPDLGAVSDGTIYSTGFAVLRWTEMPAVLLELGFIDHPRDRKRIVQEDFHKDVAKAVARGMKVFLGMNADD